MFLKSFFKKEKEYVTIPQKIDYPTTPSYPQVVPYWDKFYTTGDPMDNQIYCSSNIKLEL